MISFEEYLSESITDEIKVLEKELEQLATQRAYIRKTGKIPSNVKTTIRDKSDYYDYTYDRAEEIEKEIESLKKEQEESIPDNLFSNPKFKSWFSKSKVVDRVGNPLAVYHGSNADIKEFSHDFNMSATNASQYGAGFYFTTDPEEASGYADTKKDFPVVYKVYLSIQKPLESTSTKQLTRSQIEQLIKLAPELDDALNQMYDVEYEGRAKVIRMVINDVFDGQDEELLKTLFTINNDFYSGHDKEFVDAITAVLKYDGIHVSHGNRDHWIAFRSTQIKSATGNIKQKFSKKSGNIDEHVSFEDYLLEAFNPDSYSDIQETPCELFLTRAQPFHNGHLEIIKKMKNPILALVKGEKTSKDKEHNPLSTSYQIKLIKKVLPQLKIIVVHRGFVPEIINQLRKKGSEVSKLYAGEDRLNGYKEQVKLFNSKVPDSKKMNIKFIKTPRITSATEVRDAIRSNDKEKFESNVPKSIWGEFNKLKSILEDVTVTPNVAVISKPLVKDVLRRKKPQEVGVEETDDSEEVKEKKPKIKSKKINI